jgi:hypothetical protein
MSVASFSAMMLVLCENQSKNIPHRAVLAKLETSSRVSVQRTIRCLPTAPVLQLIHFFHASFNLTSSSVVVWHQRRIHLRICFWFHRNGTTFDIGFFCKLFENIGLRGSFGNIKAENAM